MTTVIQAFSTNDYQNVGSYQNAYFSAVGSGNSLVLILRVPDAQLPLTATPETWNGSAAVSMGAAITTDTSVAGQTNYVYKLDNITNGANQIRWKTSATGQCASDVLELGTSGATLTLGTDQKTAGGPNDVTFNNPVANSVAIVTLDLGGGPTVTPTAPYLKATHGNYSVDTLYNADIGAVGSKSAFWTLDSSYTRANWVLTFSTASPGPTVSTITGTTATEGSAVVFTVTMSGTGGGTYAYSWSGTASSADYTQTLTNGMFAVTGGSGNVTVSGSNITVDSTVTAFTVTVPTTGDTLDEDDETIVLRVGGVDSTGGTITDDDATPAVIIPGPATVDGGDSVVLSYSIPVVSGRVTQARLVLADGTAVGGTNYTNVITDLMLSDGVTISAGVLSIPAGVGSFTITIPTAA